MTEPNTTAAATPAAYTAPFGTIPFKDDTIRYLRVGDLPWLSMHDVCRVLQIDWDDTLDVCVNDVHKGWDNHPETGELLPWIAPIGAWTLAQFWRRPIDTTFHFWLFKAVKALQPDAFNRERYGAVAKMALQPDGRMPPTVPKKSGRFYERDALSDAPGHRTGPSAYPRLIYPDAPPVDVKALHAILAAGAAPDAPPLPELASGRNPLH